MAHRNIRARPGSGEPATLASSAYEKLRREIIAGAFPPGRKLHIRGLCERYQMGLSPVREALNRVSRDGLVQQSDLRGFSVAPVTEQDLVDLTRARCWLNELALRQSIAHGGADWEEGIVLAYDRFVRTRELSRSAEPGGRNSHEIAHRQFHASLISACGSERLSDYCEQLFDAADRYRYLRRPSQPLDKHMGKGHQGLMEAVLARDVERAVELLTTHFRNTERIATAEMRRLAAIDHAPP